MDDFFKSKTDLVRRWDVSAVDCILRDDPLQADQIILNLLCNPFTKAEVFGYLIGQRASQKIISRYQENFIQAQMNFLTLNRFPDIINETSALATAALMKTKCKKLERFDGELRKTICTLLENEPMVEELYLHLFQGDPIN